MSAMKNFEVDRADLAERAIKAARESTTESRMRAIRSVFEECGSVAARYADPATVAAILVTYSARAFMAERTSRDYSAAG